MDGTSRPSVREKRYPGNKVGHQSSKNVTRHRDVQRIAAHLSAVCFKIEQKQCLVRFTRLCISQRCCAEPDWHGEVQF